MLQSMTGYGASEKGGFKVEVKSLNHKFIDVSVRIPSALMEHEIPVRNLIKERFSRGKLDVTISLTDKSRLKVSVNKELTRGIYEAFSDVQKELSIPGSLDIGFFSGYREILLTEEPEYNTDALYEAFRNSIALVEEMRKTEGSALKKELASRLDKLEKTEVEIEALSKNKTFNYKGMLLKRLADLAPEVQLDDARVAQEAAIIAQKGDIAEELARLKSHFKQFYSFMEEGGSVGRRLDFIIQEMNREVNTIGSKADDVRIINLIIEMKSEIERVREQVQNIQ